VDTLHKGDDDDNDNNDNNNNNNNNKMKGNVRGSLLKYHPEVQSIFYMNVSGRLSGPGAL